MKSNKISVFSHKIFGQIVLKKIKKNILNDKNLLLEKADIKMVYDEYQSYTVFSSILSLIIGIILGVSSFYLIKNNYSIIILILSTIIPVLSTFWFFQFYPFYLANKRAKNIDRYLPYAVNFISTMSAAGLSPAEIFRSLSDINTYGELQIESKKIIKKIDGMGIDNISALKKAIETSPSKKFKSFLQGMIGTIQAGSNLHDYLSNIVDDYMEKDFVSRKKSLQMLSVVAEVFVLTAVAFPLFLIIIMSVMSFLIGPPDFTVDTLFIFSFLILPLTYVCFYYMIFSVNDEEKSKKFSKKQKLDFKEFFKKNKTILFIALITITCLFIFNISFYLIYYKESSVFNAVFISILILTGPFGFYYSRINQNKREARERLADFFVEISSSLSSGMTIFESIKKASRGNYGVLTKNIKKMKAELSWRYSISTVFNNFVNKMRIGVFNRVFTTVNKGLKMGGKTDKVFKAAARELNQVNRIEDQKRSNMSIYTVVIVMSFFVFLAIIFILNQTLFVTFFETGELSASQTPYEAGNNLKISSVDPLLFQNALYSFVFVQGFGAGALGGYMLEGSLRASLRYSFILGLVSVMVFNLLI